MLIKINYLFALIGKYNRGDWDFITQLLQTLQYAVKDEDETLLVTQNVREYDNQV